MTLDPSAQTAASSDDEHRELSWLDHPTCEELAWLEHLRLRVAARRPGAEPVSDAAASLPLFGLRLLKHR